MEGIWWWVLVTCFEGGTRKGVQLQKGAFEGLNGPSVCFMQWMETAGRWPNRSSVPQEMSLYFALLWKRSGQTVNNIRRVITLWEPYMWSGRVSTQSRYLKQKTVDSKINFLSVYYPRLPVPRTVMRSFKIGHEFCEYYSQMRQVYR